jgi:hypothetical protein
MDSPEQELKAGIISLRSPGEGPEMVKPLKQEIINREILLEFEKGLFDLIKEIFNPDIPFSQTEDEDRCKYCTFNEMCNRISPGENY